MLREHQYVFNRVNMLFDLALTGLSVWLAHLLRNALIGPYLLPDVFPKPARFADYAWLAYTLPPVMVILLRLNGYYHSQRIRPFGETARIVFFSAVETAVVAMVVTFFFSRDKVSEAFSGVVVGEAVSRGVIVLVPLVLTGLMLLKSFLVRRVLIRLRARGKNWRSLLLVGSGDNLRDFIRHIRSHPYWGFRLEGIVDDSGREAQLVEDVPVVAPLTSLIEYLERHPVDEVVFVPGRRPLEDLAPYFGQCEVIGMRTRLSLNFFRHTIARPVLDAFEGIPVVTYLPTRELNAALLFKYAFDRLAAAVLLLLMSPVFLAAYLAVKINSRSWTDPAFYGQIRCGLNGRTFTLWKFRSMRIGAEKQLTELLARNEMGGPVFKMREDPRITAVGKWLRKTSMDELPQLWNVLNGEMSLVGPRPPIPAEVEKYDPWQRRRLSMKPGITCLWQVNGRNNLPFDTWMKLDLEYIDNWSLYLDFKILLKTVYVVATGYGAM